MLFHASDVIHASDKNGIFLRDYNCINIFIRNKIYTFLSFTMECYAIYSINYNLCSKS